MTRFSLAAVLLAFGAAWHPARAAASDSGQRIVSFDRSVSLADADRTMRDRGFPVVRRLELIHALVVRVDGNIEDERLSSVPRVVRVENDRLLKWLDSAPASAWEELSAAAPAPPIPPSSPRAEEDLPWGIRRVDAPKAWTLTRGAGAAVAVLDTGIETAHPKLAGNIAGGWNAVEPGKPYEDDNGHGTAVAGVIAAQWNGSGAAGVAPEARLYAVKVVDKSGMASVSTVIAGLEWVVARGIRVVNMSLSATEGDESLHEAIRQTAAAGTLIVCSAGNTESTVGFPGAYPEALAVTASTVLDTFYLFSSRGPEVSFIAPGTEILTTYPPASEKILSGTSMAAPHVAGLAALKLSRSGGSSLADLRLALLSAAVPLPRLGPNLQGKGLIDAWLLVKVPVLR